MNDATEWFRRLVNMTGMTIDSIVYVHSGIYEWHFHNEMPDHPMHSARESALWIFSHLMASDASCQNFDLSVNEILDISANNFAFALMLDQYNPLLFYDL